MEMITTVKATTDHEQTSLVPADLIAKAKEYARASKSPATLKVYVGVWALFTSWCDERGLEALPAATETVVAYIADQGDRLRPQTIKKHLAAISQLHKHRGYESPVQTEPVRLTMQGLRRVKGIASQPKRALRVENIKAMIASMPDDILAVRDTAVVLLGYVTGMRRSEIANLNVGDLTWEPEGIVVTIWRSKRDQEGRGRQVPIPRGRHEATCPVRAIKAWLAASGIEDGPLFVRLDRAGDRQRLSGKAISRIVKKVAARSSLDPTMLGAHSLRRGFVTSTIRAGADPRDVRRATGHSARVMEGYVEEDQALQKAAARYLDL